MDDVLLILALRSEFSQNSSPTSEVDLGGILMGLFIIGMLTYLSYLMLHDFVVFLLNRICQNKFEYKFFIHHDDEIKRH